MPGHACPAALMIGTRRMGWCSVAKIQALLAVVVLSGGCASWYVADADREVHAALASYEQRTLGDRAEWVQQPAPSAESAAPTSAPFGAESQPAASAPTDTLPAEAIESGGREPLVLDLQTSLRLAFSSSRDYLDQRESLYLAGLRFTLTRYNFGPILNSTISYLWNDAENSRGSDSLAAGLGVSQILPTGGDLAVSGAVSGSRADDPDLFTPPDPSEYAYDSTVQLNLRQPLLRGFGYEVSHEALTQGERDLIYSLRAFELFREDFCIRITDAYYRLVSQKARLANDEQNYRDAVYDRERTEAMLQTDRARPDDVFLARRREIEAEDALLVSRTDYKLALDDFKILLGLPTASPIELVDDEPEFQAVRIDPQSAVQVAHHNRLDLQTIRDRVEDTERQVRLASNGLLPDLDLSVDWAFDNDVSKPYDPTPERWSAAVGATLELPLDRKSERNAYRSALIALAQTRRDLERRLDEVERDILDQLRELQQLEKRITLQKDQVAFEKKAVEVTRIRRESGEAQTRDLLDARQGLINAQNALINLKVQHFVARLRLRRNLGVLFIDEEGMWRE
jgi:outer membrane protein TolC